MLGLRPGGFHRIHYCEWGPPAAERMVVCVHGYSGNGRDFDPLAQALSVDRRVLCPDMAGRGQSDWFASALEYHFPQFLSDLNAMLARSGAQSVDWVGTSMGGLLGLLLAAQPGSPIRRLVLNDVGAFLPGPALRHIGRNLEAPASFPSLKAVESHLRRTRAEWGPIDDAQWRRWAKHHAREVGGAFRLHYDPAIARHTHPMSMTPGLYFWDAWQRVQIPTLLIRGEDSTVFPRMVAESMLLRHPHATLEEIPGCGHAPALVSKAQIALVRDFLEGPLHWRDEASDPLSAGAAR